MKVSIIIPNYNGKQLLEKNLPQVLKLKGILEVIIVDDASTDGSCPFIRKTFPQIKLIEKVTNSGFSATVNIGVLAAKGDIVYLLNSDALPHQDFLIPLLAHFNENQVFAVGSLDESYEDGTFVKRGRGIGAFKRGFFVHQKGEPTLMNTLWVNGGSGAFRKSYWEKLGGLDELYSPFYWEDIDISYRALKSGYTLVFEPKSIVEHRHEEGSIKKQYQERQIKEISYRNQCLFVWKNITDSQMLMSHIMWLPYYFFWALISFDLSFIKGFSQALFLLKEVLKKRAYQKSFYVIKDTDIFKEFSR